MRVNEYGNGGHVWGTLTVRNDTTTWDLHIQDTRTDGKRVWAVLDVDRNNHGDPTFSSRPSAGAVVNFAGSTHQSGTRGARLKIDKDDSSAVEVLYVHEGD